MSAQFSPREGDALMDVVCHKCRLPPLIIVFAKAPMPGRVKTRLCSVLSPDDAAELHNAFVRDTLDTLLTLRPAVDLELSTDVPTEAWFDIPVSRSLQGSGDLGERMLGALAKAIAGGHCSAMVVGSDSPGLPAAHIEALLQSRADVTLGPTEDGGYYAIVCRKTDPAIFESVRWSTSATLEDTIRAVKNCGLLVDLGPSWFDVDEPADLTRLVGVGGLPFHTAKWIDVHEGRLGKTNLPL